MKVLLLGGGGREHALALAIAESPECDKLLIAPGNAGTCEVGSNVAISENDFQAVKQLVLTEAVDLVVVGPEKPLVNGIVDFFHKDAELAGVAIAGPDEQAAQLEGSKAYAKQFMKRYGIPTGAFATFQAEEMDKAREVLQHQNPPYVIKADGLASGKGVTISSNREEALQTLEDYFIKEKLGGAGKQVVLEEYLHGKELSVFIMADGEDYVMLPNARDYKRVGEGDTGPNTGGMGAISPVPGISEALMHKVEAEIINPTLSGLKEENVHFRGFLYFGLILVDGAPYVLEYNVRLGDPEAEVILPRMQSDMLTLLRQSVQQELKHAEPSLSPESGATVMMVSGGYPGAYEQGKPIHGLNDIKHSHVFHAGTKAENGNVVTAGGRVLAVTGLGSDLQAALGQCYSDLEKIHFEKAYYRNDIGQTDV